MKVSEFVRQAVAHENRNFQKVIFNVAVGLGKCGFFDATDWRKTLEECFEQTCTQIQMESTELSDVDISYETTFSNILAESTPAVADSVQTGKRVKRSSTLLQDTQPFHKFRKKLEKLSNLRQNYAKVVNILADLKETKWEQILPDINAEQNAIKHESPFERVQHLRSVETSSEVGPSSNLTNTECEPGEKTVTSCNSIRKRRNTADFTPSAKREAKASQGSDNVPVSIPVVQVANVSKTDTTVVNPQTSSDATFAGYNDTPRRRSGRKIKPPATYSDAAFYTMTKRRGQRRRLDLSSTSVSFAMIDSLQYRKILSKFNIVVADSNDKCNYVVAERINCSPQFLSAVVTGTPIVSIQWIHDLDEKGQWLNPLVYLLKDDNGEKEYNFDLAATQKMASGKRLFENCSVLITPHIIPADLESVILSGGGTFLQTNLNTATSADEILCVSDTTDKEIWPKLRQQYPRLRKIISLGGFHKMIFQHTHDISSTDILYHISARMYASNAGIE